MGSVRQVILACSALAPIALSSPAHAALDSGLRGPILQIRTNSADVSAKPHGRKLAIRGLNFSDAHSDAPSVDYLAAASTSAGYHKTSRQIATSMGFLGNANGAHVIIGIVDTG